MLGAWLAVAGIRAKTIRGVFPGAALVLGGHRQGAPPRRRPSQTLGELLGPGGPRRLGRALVAQNRLDGEAGNRPRRALISAVFCVTHPRLITEAVTGLNRCYLVCASHCGC